MRSATAQKIAVLRFAAIASGAPARDEWLTRPLRSGKHEDSLAFPCVEHFTAPSGSGAVATPYIALN